MNKIIVIGCPGSGKSTFSRKLHKKTGIHLYHLDMLFWNADKTTVTASEFEIRLFRAINEDSWILDGNFIATLECRINACDTIFFLDYPLDVCLDGVRSRRGQPRSDMPWVEEEEDPEFLEFIRSFQGETRCEIYKLLDTYAHKKIHIFKSRDEANRYLAQLP